MRVEVNVNLALPLLLLGVLHVLLLTLTQARARGWCAVGLLIATAVVGKVRVNVAYITLCIITVIGAIHAAAVCCSPLSITRLSGCHRQ
jgi:hypothetical protein